MKKLKLIVMMILMTFLIGCSSTQENIQCIYPDFPTPSKEVKKVLKETHNEEVIVWIYDLVKLKDKLNYLRNNNE